MIDFSIIIAERERNGLCVGSVSSLGGNGKSQGGSARANTGSGGTGRGFAVTTASGGGGAGAICNVVINSPAGT